MYYVKTKSPDLSHRSGLPALTLEEALQLADANDGLTVVVNSNITEQIVMIVQDKHVQATFENLGEGHHGDYDPEDPDDESLLRCVVSRRGDEGAWEEVEDANFCTSLPVCNGTEPQELALQRIHAVYAAHFALYPDKPVKRIGEYLSHMGE